jgi:hypothetical protein
MPLFGEQIGGQVPFEPPIALRRGIGVTGVAGTVVFGGGTVRAVGCVAVGSATGLGIWGAGATVGGGRAGGVAGTLWSVGARPAGTVVGGGCACSPEGAVWPVGIDPEGIVVGAGPCVAAALVGLDPAGMVVGVGAGVIGPPGAIVGHTR